METEAVFAPFLCLSLVMLEREQPALYAQLCAAFGTQRVNATVGDEHVQIVGDGSALAVLPRLAGPRSTASGSIWVESELRAIDDVLDGRATLLELVWGDRIRLFGALDALLAMHDALRLYLHAAVRSPSAPRLLRAFRAKVAATTATAAHAAQRS